MNNPQPSPKIQALYGHPVEHSLSPAMFNATYKRLGLNREYLAFSVTRDGIEQAVDSAVARGFEGFNVTMPLKECIIPLLDKLEADAMEAGAVNTIAVRDSRLIGYNTDGEGALLALKASGFDRSVHSVLILGAGGAARGIVNALVKRGLVLTIMNRTRERARGIANAYRGKGNVAFAISSKTSLLKTIAEVDLVINTTPLPIASLFETLAVSMNSIPERVTIFDIAYQYETDSHKPRHGISRISPFELLFQQALLSYQIWMDTSPPYETMRRALIERIGG